MSNMSNEKLPEFKIDTDNLYSETIVTDRKVGTLTRLEPITAAGEPDSSREALFVGQAQLYTPAGALPVSADIEAATIKEALEKFPAAMQQALEKTLKEIEEMRRQQASQIVVPGGEGGGVPGMGGVPGGGVGGKLQMP